MKNNNNKIDQRFYSTRQLVWLAVLLAFVLVFQVFGSQIKIGTTNLSFVLIPIVLGGILLGVFAGFVLGLAFSIIVMIMGFTGNDPFTHIILQENLLGTLITIYSKGILCGVIPAIVYKVIKNKKVGVFISSLLAPIINTGIFIICMLCMSGMIEKNFVASGSTVIYFLVIGCAGINFLVELALNIVLAPAIARVTRFIREKR